MKRLIAFPLSGGGSIVVEVDEPAEGGTERATRPGEIAARATQTFEEALDTLKPAAATILQKLRSLSDAPDEVAVTFGVKLSAEAGAFIAAVGAEANYSVSLTWKRGKDGNIVS